ncbi:MAG: hypothetical protein EON93_23405 [Burkholderiales bacterium]|nr:MAG: hypothetical protein EON93_23405 [Burkholderiales bacterium]
MSELAARFLGDGRMFFALSRYNGLAAPNALSAGRVLKLPTSARRAATSSVATRARAADAARANEVRLQALQLLNTGEVDRAVALLREAASLDATDPAIRKDLERAERIQGALTDG